MTPPPPDDLDLSGLDGLWAKAASQTAEWRLLTMRLPSSDKAPVTFQIDRGYPGQPQKRLTLAYDRQSGELKSRESYADLDAGRRARTWLRFAHTGEFYGIAGQTIAGIASAAGVVLTYTGIALSLRRLSAWRVRRRRTHTASALGES